MQNDAICFINTEKSFVEIIAVYFTEDFSSFRRVNCASVQIQDFTSHEAQNGALTYPITYYDVCASRGSAQPTP